MLVWRSLCFIQFFILLVSFIYLGLSPSPENVVPVFNDKLMHFSGYCVAGFSISFAFPRARLWQRALFLILFSIAIEIGQHFMPPRSFDINDIAANSSGVIVGLLLLTFLEIKLKWFGELLHLSQKQLLK